MIARCRGHRVDTMTVYLVNPSHVSFGIGVITPRWLYVLAAATPAAVGAPRLIDETLERFDTAAITAGDVVGIGIHTGQCPARLRDRRCGAGRRRVRRVRRHPRDALSRRGARARRRARRGHRATANAPGPRRSATVWQALRATITPVAESKATRSSPAGGTCCRPDGTCGRRCRRCAAARSTARSARSGEPMASGRGSAHVDRGARRNRGAAAARLPVHRARRRQLLSGHAQRPADGGAARGPEPARALQAIRAERFELMERLAQLPARHGVLHADHDGGRRRPGVPGRDAPGPHQGRARRRRGGDARGAEGRLQGLQRERRGAGRRGSRHSGAHGVHVLGSFIFGLPSDRAEHVRRHAVGGRAGRPDVRAVRDADAVSRARSTSPRGRSRWATEPPKVGGVPVSRHWLIPQAQRPKVYMDASGDERRTRSATARRACGTGSIRCRSIWKRSRGR